MTDFFLILGAKLLRRGSRVCIGLHKVFRVPTAWLWKQHTNLNRSAYRMLKRREKYNKTKHPPSFNTRVPEALLERSGNPAEKENSAS